jgi:antitoxin PrlF
MAKIESKAKLTSKGQVTIPIAARKALDLQDGDSIAFVVLDGGKVEMFKEAAVNSDDRVVAAYLRFLEQDLVSNPGKLEPFVRPQGVDDLVSGVELDGWLEENQKA